MKYNVDSGKDKLRDAADDNQADAQYCLGWNYDNGTCGFVFEPVLAVYWLKRAASHGHLEAHSYLARMQLSKEERHYWLLEGAKLGEPYCYKKVKEMINETV